MERQIDRQASKWRYKLEKERLPDRIHDNVGQVVGKFGIAGGDKTINHNGSLQGHGAVGAHSLHNTDGPIKTCNNNFKFHQ